MSEADKCPTCRSPIPDGARGDYVCTCGAALVVAEWEPIRRQLREMYAAGDAAAIELVRELEAGGIDVLYESGEDTT